MLAVHPQFEPASWESTTDDRPIYANMPPLCPPGNDTPHNRLSGIFDQLRYLTAQLYKPDSTKTRFSSSDMQGFSKARSSIEHALLSLSMIHTNTIADTARYTKKVSSTIVTFEAHRVAALIFLNLVLRECLPYGHLLQSIKSQLLEILQTTRGATSCLRSQPKTAIWTYFMGGLLSVNGAEEEWFADRIRETMIVMDIEEWEDMEEVLRETVWVESLKVPTWVSLWQRVISG